MRLLLRGLLVEFRSILAYYKPFRPARSFGRKAGRCYDPPERTQKRKRGVSQEAREYEPSCDCNFFDKVCIGVLEALIRPTEGEIGILGEVSTYFGAVKTNGRGMLHATVWCGLRETLASST